MKYRFEQLVNLDQMCKLLESHNGFSGMAYGLFDTDENNLLAVGWQDICMQFHRMHPVSCARCRESDAYLKKHIAGFKGEFFEYRCKNGMIDVAMPVMVEDRHLATFFAGQFFYDDDLPDREFFIKQADMLGFDQEAYLAALDRVPLFSRELVRSNMLFLHNMVEMLAEIGLANMKQVRETEERKLAEGRLLEVRNRLATIFATIPDMVWMKDKDGIYLACNSAFEEFSGVAEADLIGKTDYDLMDAEQADCCRKSDRDAIVVDKISLSEEEVTYAVGGRRGLLEIRKVPVYGADSCLTGVLGIGRDITERRHTENTLLQQNIFQNSLFMGLQNADVNLLLAEGGRLTYCNNSRFGEPFGFSEADMAAKPEFIRFVHPDDRARIAEIYRRRSAGEPMPTNFEFSVQWANGERREVELVVSVIGYNPLKTLFIYKDVTERKRMEDELQRKNSELERFSYTVSHDLKSPIITIKSFSGSIKNDLGNGRHDRIGKDLDRICTAADKMVMLLDDLLKLSSSGKVIDTPVSVDMTLLAGEVLKDLAGILQESGAQVLVQPGLPTVMCDRQRMAEVLQNLIENAVKYQGEHPEPRIEIGLRDDDGRQVFFVQDNGPGIDPKYHENIFGLFNRLDTRLPGTGIGLALVKRIVEVHGGSVWVESDGCGNGSTFCFTVG